MEYQKLPGAVRQTYKKGDILIHQGETVTHLYYLVKGTIYREVITLDGYESIPSVKTAADEGVASLVGVLTLFYGDGEVISNSSFIANTTCVCYKIPRESVLYYFKTHPEDLIEVLHLALKEHEKLFQLLIMKNEGQAANRLCAILLERSIEKDGIQQVVSRNINTDLSKFLSIHKVTVARIIKQLKIEEVIDKKNGYIRILKPDVLQEYADCVKQLKYF